jgi:hypothetical protein
MTKKKLTADGRPFRVSDADLDWAHSSAADDGRPLAIRINVPSRGASSGDRLPSILPGSGWPALGGRGWGVKLIAISLTAASMASVRNKCIRNQTQQPLVNVVIVGRVPAEVACPYKALQLAGSGAPSSVNLWV